MLEAELFGLSDEPTGDSACGMPLSVQVERLRQQLADAERDRVSVLTVDLYSLEGVERDVALDAVVAGEPSPFVLMGGRLVCSGAVDVPVILEALG